MSPPLLPLIRYRDPDSALDWLEAAFGFERVAQELAGDGSLAHALMRLDGSTIMLAPVRDTVFDQLFRHPDEIGGKETQACFFVVRDLEAHIARAKSEGAEIVLDIGDCDHGGRGYSCRDPEGHLWTFGTAEAVPMGNGGRVGSRLTEAPAGIGRAPAAMAAVLAGGFLVASALVWVLTSSPSWNRSAAALARLDAEQTAREAAERKAGTAEQMAEREREARQQAEQTVAELRQRLDAADRTASAGTDALPAASDARARGPDETMAVGPTDDRGETGSEGADAAASSTDPLIAAGQQQLKLGNVVAARRHFQAAAEAGLAEGALALGATYDPVGLARAGLGAGEADAAAARQWYRRAHELAHAATHRIRQTSEQ